MKTISLSLLGAILFFYATAQRNDLLWLKQISGTGNSTPTAIVVDAAGNHYVAGNFTTTITVESNSLTSAGGQDIYIVKYNTQGQALWQFSIGGSSAENVWGISLSPDGNYLYVGGQFQSNNCNFNGTILSTSGQNDLFLAKYRTSDGVLEWAIKSAYGPTQQLIGNITVDNQGNIVQVGKYIDNVTFYGGLLSLTSTFIGIQQNFVAKFDQDGNVLWAKQFSGDNSNSLIRNVTADNNSYYFSGFYAGLFNLDAIPLNSNALSRDMILFRTDLSGNVQWYRIIAGTGDDYLIRHYTDNSSFQFIAGYYNSPSLVIDSTATEVSLKSCPNVGSNDILTACYSFDGTLQWVRAYGSSGDDQGWGVYANADHVAFSGLYTGNISFGSFNLTNSSSDGFMLETDRNGNVLGVNRAWGNLVDNTNFATIDANGANLFVGSFFSSTLTVGNKTLSNSSTSTTDMFFAKYGRIILSFNVTNNVCYGSNIGAIDLTVSGDGLPPYTYQWSGPYGFTSTDEDISNLYAGWYKVTVTDANLAIKVDSAYVSEGNAILLDFNNTNTSCYGINDGAIDLTVSGGASPYTFLWSTGATIEDINGLAPGPYSVTVTDANSCSTTGSTTISSPSPINVSEVISPPTCVPGNDGAIDISVFGGTPPYTFAWSNGSTTEDISSLNTGTYSVTITDLNNCTAIKTYNLVNPLAPTVSALLESPSCFPGNDGSIDIIVSGGTMPFSYLWNDGDINEDRTNLSAGNYSVTVTDANNCSAVKENMILPSNNPPSLSAISTKPSCDPGADGAIDLIVYNGTAPFTFNWSNGSTTEDIAGLLPGTYSVTVADAKNCTTTLTQVLTTDSPIVSITYIGNTTFCQGDSILLYATNESGFTFEWSVDGNSILNSNVPVLSAKQSGTYQVVVTNLSGCKGYSNTVTITVNPSPTITINASSNFICEGTPVLLTAGGAVSYSWSNGSTSNPITVQPSTTTTYTVTGTDANGCTNTNQIAITVNQRPAISAVVTNETCSNGTGAIDITVTGGTTPYTFAWSNGNTTEDISNLNDGTYTVTVSTAFSCTNTYTTTVGAYIPLSASINTHSLLIFCNNIANGEAHVTTLNGNPPYTYQWSNSITTSYNTQLPAGINYVTVTDQCNETVVDSIVVGAMPSLQINISSSLPATCSTSTNGQATVTTLNGVQPFAYAWSNSMSVSAVASDLPVGMQYVTVTDYCGSVIDSVYIDYLPAMQASIASTTPITCAGNNDGTATVLIVDGVPPFTYVWSNGETTSTATQLGQGLQSVTVTDACGWTILSTTISVASPLSISITDSTAASCSTISDGTAFVTAVNGTPPYSYAWSSGETVPNASQLSEGWNYVTVTDVCGSLVDSVLITVIPPVTATISFVNDATCKNSQDGKAIVMVENGVAPYQFAWSNSQSTSNMAFDLTPGWNYVTVTDICNTSVDSVYVGYRTPLMPSLILTSTNCSTDSTGSAMVIAQYGVPPFTYNWSYGSSTDSLLTQLPAGQYMVTVSDFCGDTVLSFQITPLPLLELQYQKTDVTCFGQSTGQIILYPDKGVPPYQYTWSNGLPPLSSQTGLNSGWYKLTVSDQCGSITDSVLISQPVPIQVLSSISPASSDIANDGQIEITVLGGIQPYSFVWSNNETTSNLNNITAGNYTLTITDANNCLYVDTFTVDFDAELEVFNTFTPNGDGKNDVWNIPFLKYYPNCEVSVFDQWGVKVFESVGYSTPWDGKYKGKELPAGTYYYVIDLKNNNKALTGSLTIIK